MHGQPIQIEFRSREEFKKFKDSICNDTRPDSFARKKIKMSFLPPTKIIKCEKRG
jgi:hypothetical protein